ncbi:MAG: hypothetical protein KDE56_11190, partial [Anaerolineales bacterium]|nr:hypothetical protein [Anaerolineales bacterium]
GAFHAHFGRAFRLGDLGYLSNAETLAKEPTSTEKFPAIASAIARIKDSDSPDLSNFLYTLEAGVHRELAEGFTNQFFTLPIQENEILFHISVHAEDMALKSPRIQPFLYRPDQEAPLVEFKLRPTKLGKKRIWVEFLYQNHWLAQIELNVTVTQLVAESIEQS